MGIINERRKFKRKVEQHDPTNPTGNTHVETNKFDIDSDSIKDQQKK